ncbi:hypothetical protein LTS18_011155 [Coniosporium uncinatum]|uniref:Uncharacterized protein n=1 Tax=Coniosporium uncinatum TaxID=93489 RepID=A0ACC3DWC1_9PEZI|nr:hypothetical protein LTS18_011155 [Coniosporium uncinatum]
MGQDPDDQALRAGWLFSSSNPSTVQQLCSQEAQPLVFSIGGIALNQSAYGKDRQRHHRSHPHALLAAIPEPMWIYCEPHARRLKASDLKGVHLSVFERILTDASASTVHPPPEESGYLSTSKEGKDVDALLVA